ncbi:MAG: hypothetical protein AAF497_18700 [Planctomycetota bacterium]
MIPKLSRLLSFTSHRRIGRTGFVYEPESDPGPLHNAVAGDIARTQTVPPWIVVDHSKTSITFTNWPGCLWLVEVDEPAPRWEQMNDIYTRARSVRLLKRESPNDIFGLYGDKVAAILDKASQLSTDTVHQFPAATPAAHRSYSNGWDTWIKDSDTETQSEMEHRNTLSLGFSGRDSPIGPGFVLLHNVIWKRAGQIDRESAILLDEDGEFHFSEQWQAAFDAAKHAAMAVALPNAFTNSELHELTSPWRQVVD